MTKARRGRVVASLVVGAACLAAASATRADDAGATADASVAPTVNVAAGATLSLTADIVLTNTDNFVAGDDSGARCVIHGNGFSIQAPQDLNGAGWTGTLSIHNCDVDGLGQASAPSIDAYAAGMGAISIVGSTFSTSSRFNLNISAHVSVTFNGNTLNDDTTTPEVIALMDSLPIFWSTGSSDGTKVFQGNHIFRGRIKFTSSSGWLIGGSMPGDGNIMFGVRTGIELESDTMMTVRGNYSRTDVGGDMWNQVKNLAVDLGAGGNVIEHNVFIGLNWLVEMDGGGELRYNLFIDNIERGWVLVWADADAKVHHNIAVSTRDNQSQPLGGIVVEQGAAGSLPTTEIYNNTLDLGGTCTPSLEAGVMLKGDSMLGSLRSNALVDVREVGWTTPPGLVRAYDTQGGDHIMYADYNLFWTPDSPVKVNYAVTVPGKTERTSAGFALNDVPKGGAVDAQVDPMFAGVAGVGKVPRTFPFDEKDLVTGKLTVCQILAYYRQIYTPGAGSPLIDSGDPADGAGNDVGAVGAGTPNDLDLFGKLCDPTDVGVPAADPTMFTCPNVALALPGGTGETPIVMPHGIVCVCDAGAGAPNPGGVAALAALVVIVAAARRRQRRS